MVINHNSGADQEEQNTLDGEKRWTKFTPKSGRFHRDWNCFHPSRFEQVMIEGENFADFPHLCHRIPVVYTELFNYSRMLIEELGFDLGSCGNEGCPSYEVLCPLLSQLSADRVVCEIFEESERAIFKSTA